MWKPHPGPSRPQWWPEGPVTTDPERTLTMARDRVKIDKLARMLTNELSLATQPCDGFAHDPQAAEDTAYRLISEIEQGSPGPVTLHASDLVDLLDYIRCTLTPNK